MIVGGDGSQLEPTLGELAALHERMKTRGYQDFTTAVLTTGLAEVGRSKAAASLLATYLEHERREAVPPPPALMRIARRLGVGIGEVPDVLTRNYEATF